MPAFIGTNIRVQHLVLTTTGAKPTIPSPATLTPNDSGWKSTDIMKGEWAHNIEDDIWYYRTKSDVIKSTSVQDISGKADKSNVLEKNNTTEFIPSADYHPATKKYVDDNLGSGGTGLTLGEWNYEDTTTAPPSDNSFRFNNATIASATKLYIDDNDDQGTDWGAKLNCPDGSWINLGSSKDKQIQAQVSGATDQSGYWEYDIDGIVVEGTFTDGDTVSVVIDINKDISPITEAWSETILFDKLERASTFGDTNNYAETLAENKTFVYSFTGAIQKGGSLREAVGNGTYTLTFPTNSNKTREIRVDSAATGSLSENVYTPSNGEVVKVYFEYDNGYVDVIIRHINVLPGDTEAPTFSAAPASANVLHTAFDITATLSENGNVYAVVVADGESAPTSSEVKAGTGSGGSGELATGSAADSGSGVTLNLTGLTQNTAYDVYVVGEDSLSNLMASPTKVDVSTLALPTIVSVAFATDNTYADITFSKGIYGANDGSTPAALADINDTFTQGGGTATAWTPSSAKQNDNTSEGSASALAGGETVIRIFGSATGTPDGNESVEFAPTDGASLYDADGGAMDSGESASDNLSDESLPQLATPQFNVLPASGQNTITIDPVLNADDYEILFSTTNDVGTASAVPTYDGTSLTYVHGSLSNGTTYYYWVKAMADAGYSDSEYGTGQGTPAVTSPPVVTNRAVNFGEPNDVVLTFNEAVNFSGHAGVTLEYDSGSGWTALTKTGATGTGSSVMTITVSETILSTWLLRWSYVPASGDITSDASSVELETVTNQDVSNNLAFDPSDLAPDYFHEDDIDFDGATSINTGIYNTFATKNYFHVFVKYAPDDGNPAANETIVGGRDAATNTRMLIFLGTTGNINYVLGDTSINVGSPVNPVFANGPTTAKTIHILRQPSFTRIACLEDSTQSSAQTDGSSVEQLTYPIHYGANNNQGTLAYANAAGKALFIWSGDIDLSEQNITNLENWFLAR